MRLRIGAFEMTKRGGAAFDWRDPYYLALAVGWRGFALLFLAAELGINLAFAALYLVQPGCVANLPPGSFTSAFFFSMETLATVGYGVMAPATLYGHVVASTEIIGGVAFTAIMTGLTFVRFSRPRSQLTYAGHAVIARHNGQPTLMLRVANPRDTPLMDATARLHVLLREVSHEGEVFRRPIELALVRAHMPMLVLTWTLMHRIGPDSPLARYTSELMSGEDLRLILSLRMFDPTLGAEVRDIRTYDAEAVLFKTRFVSAVSVDKQGRTIADLRRVGTTEPDV